MERGADLLWPLGVLGPPKPRCVTFIGARLMFGDITPAEGSLSDPLQPISAPSLEGPSYLNLPVFSEEELTEAPPTPPIAYIYTWHCDVRAVCFHQLGWKSTPCHLLNLYCTECAPVWWLPGLGAAALERDNAAIGCSWGVTVVFWVDSVRRGKAPGAVWRVWKCQVRWVRTFALNRGFRRTLLRVQRGQNPHFFQGKWAQSLVWMRGQVISNISQYWCSWTWNNESTQMIINNCRMAEDWWTTFHSFNT